MLHSSSGKLRAAVQCVTRSHWSPGSVWCHCRNVSVKTGGWKTKKVPQRYLGQPSPYTHSHLIRYGEVTPGLTQTEFEFRRQRLASLIKMQVERLTGSGASSNSSHIVIVLSHPIRYMTNDIPYPFHQNQDFLYLTGIMEPDSALVMYGSGKPDQAVLFVPRRDPSRELWDGPRSGKDGAAALTGLERVHSTEELGVVLKSLKGGTIWYDSSQPCHPHLHQTHVLPLLEGGQLTKSLRPLTHSLRAIKSPAEVTLMKAAGRITAQAFKKTMAMSKGDIDETVLYAKDGEMVLLDGGCEYFGYVSDITRTWPVNGKFSPAQRELYEAVLEVQLACLSQCNPGISLDYIYSTMLTLLARQLKELGIIAQSTSDTDTLKAARQFCPHHVGHYLGMDVHDTPELSRSQPLQPGMVITIEPGLYISEDDSSCPERFRGLGVRIEDDVVIREHGGPLILSANTPKTIAEVERACAHGED
ncbi:xaa-Pro aminopeptidase 3 isoform X2 [Sinocyclocheilus rhinocerous]|uniref:xaa-Pro aminopeptidase 3 isoform X2 n=1 Tax=Sinocyclocheilus rhinocerous TaxID=307959 RepID=UPI0007B97477|nr:PREDICTED: probable Xaa-Pro aminopeptidase 3 isoform X2 [Sinocyclocheilus rhinocerous]